MILNVMITSIYEVNLIKHVENLNTAENCMRIEIMFCDLITAADIFDAIKNIHPHHSLILSSCSNLRVAVMYSLNSITETNQIYTSDFR